MKEDANKMIESLLRHISNETYTFTRDDIDSIEWRIRELQKYINALYDAKGMKQ